MRLIAQILAVACLFIGIPCQAQIGSPANLPGLRLWVDAGDVNGTGIQPANGATITQWTDKSGAGNHLTAIAADAPTFESTGFDGTNPGVRFPIRKRLAGPNLFGSTVYQAQTTVFFVHNNVTLTRNFLINLNGYATGQGVDGRYSFHMPWINGNYYFDAGGAPGTNRLSGSYPNAATETTQVSAVSSTSVISGTAGLRQLIRFDGNAAGSDATGISPRVTGGLLIGSNTGNRYNGRFAEIIIYDRALSLSEIQSVECYLLSKWKPSSPFATCAPVLSVTKSSSIWNAGSNPLFSIPGNDMLYTIRVSRAAGIPVTSDSLFLVDSLPANMTIFHGDYNGAATGSDPIGFVDSNSGLSFNYATDVKYSDAVSAPTNFAACTYTPSAGYDANVRHICFNPTGVFDSGASSGYFELLFRAQIQ